MSFINEIDTTLDGVKDLIESGLNIDEQISIFFNVIFNHFIYDVSIL